MMTVPHHNNKPKISSPSGNQNAQRRTVIDAFSRSLPCDSCGHMPIGKVGSNPDPACQYLHEIAWLAVPAVGFLTFFSTLQCASAVIFLLCSFSAAPGRTKLHLCARSLCRSSTRTKRRRARLRDFVFSMESHAGGHGEAVVASCATVLWSKKRCLVVV